MEEASSLAAAVGASGLAPPERYEIDSDRLNWPLDQASGVPGLPEGVAVMPAPHSHAAVLKMPCASGKTYTVRRDLVGMAKEKIVLVCTCNRLFTRATCSDWAGLYGDENVYCYLDGLGQSDAAKEAKRQLKALCERGHGVLFVSIESFLVLNGILEPARVGALLLEETSELASKMLSETCPCVRPFRLLKAVAQEVPRVMYTDADFEVDGSLDGRCKRLAHYLRPNLPLRIFTLSRCAAHIRRSVRPYFDHPSAESGLNFDAWWAQLRAYLKSWRRTGDASNNRVAVACSSRTMLRSVCALAKAEGCFWCDYSSETDDEIKNIELAEPAVFWVDVGLVAFTQTLSVGVDPQGISFAAVFMYAAPVGCSVRCLMQGVLRFGRDASFPLACTTIFACIKGRPLTGAALERHQMRMENTSYFIRACKLLIEDRAQRVLQEGAAELAIRSVGLVGRGGLSASCAAIDAHGGFTSTYVAPTDEEIEIAAWAVAEQTEQREDLYSVVKAGFLRHGWIENGAALDAQAEQAFLRLPAPEESDRVAVAMYDVEVDKQISSLMNAKEQSEWFLRQLRGGTFESADAFHEHCFELVGLSFLSAAEKVFVRHWALLRRLPRSLLSTVSADEIVHLQQKREAIELHAQGTCVGHAVLVAQEAVRRSEAKSKRGAERHQQRMSNASKIASLDRVASLLLSSTSPSFFGAPGSEVLVLGTASASVVRALEAERRDQPTADGEELLLTLRSYERQICGYAEEAGLVTTIRRVCSKAYIRVDVKTRQVELTPQDDHGDSSNMSRRRASLLTTSVPGQPPPPKKPKREREIVAVVFEREQFAYKDSAGCQAVRDYSVDWKVESPHVKGLSASSRDWLESHAGHSMLTPSELRLAVEDDLCVLDPPPNPPGEGPHEDRPVGNAHSAGTLSAHSFTPAKPPRKSADGFTSRAEVLPWARVTELMDRISAQLALDLDKDMRKMLERGRDTLRRLHRDAIALPSDADGNRWKPTFYARRMPLGRLTAGSSSLQPMPKELRQWLYRGILHDLDFVNAHPTEILGLVKVARPESWKQDAPALTAYVANRNELLEKIVQWYGLPGRDFAKTAVLVVIYGGELRFWRRKVKCPVSAEKPDLPELLQLQRDASWARNIIFTESPFSSCIAPLKERVRSLRRNAGRTEEELNRSIFSYILGHVESMALEAACVVLERRGYVPTSLIYDGCLVTHNPHGDLDAALREAEVAVEAALGFSGLKLKEADMFNVASFDIEFTSRKMARQAALDAVSGGEGGEGN